METIYVSHERCSVRREGEHLRLVRSGRTFASLHLQNTKTVVLHDSVNITAPAIDLLLAKGIDVVYQSRTGKIKGRIMSAKGSSAITRLAQYTAFTNPTRRLEIAKAIVAAKIHNQLSVVKKYKYYNSSRDYGHHIKLITSYTKQIELADSVDKVMGIEGISAKYYWDCFRHNLKNPAFTRREYRPSPDYVNALLNLGYSFLANEITTCLLIKNLDIEIGFLHSIHYGRNSLVLDIMEEFRPVCIDAWILSILNKNLLKEKHFHILTGDWQLTDKGFNKFCELYYEYITSWRDKFKMQADKFKRAIVKGECYEPYAK